MIFIEGTQVSGWEAAIRGMRNPMNSWSKSDSFACMEDCGECDHVCVADKTHMRRELVVGPNDHDLMMRLVEGGPVHAKFRRMITVYVDITAPLYWWKEADTYKVGTVCNSCSTMHKIAAREFTVDDFSHEHLLSYDDVDPGDVVPTVLLDATIAALNFYREKYLKTKDKRYWWQLIQLLPSTYNQKRTIMMNYEVLAGIYPQRKNHKLDEWHEFCGWIESLPYSEIILGYK